MHVLIKKASWTAIPDTLIKSKNLSFTAKAVYCCLATINEGEELSTLKILEYTKEGITAVKTGLTELMKEGFLVRKGEEQLNGKPAYTYVLGTGYELIPESKPAPISEKTDSKELTDAMEQCVNMWNAFCIENPELSKVSALTKKRKIKLKQRIAENKDFVSKFPEILLAIKEQPFCLGANDRQWKVSFDFVIYGNDNYVKILERNYTGGSKKTSTSALKQAGNKVLERMKAAGIDI